MVSNESEVSTRTSTARARGRVVGIPRRCWCGEIIVSKMSKSDANPYRRYYRCAYAVERKLANDNHAYKWVDEALVDEIDALMLRTARMEQECLEAENKMFEKVQMKIEKEIFERVEDVLAEAKSEMRKMMILVFLGCVIIVGFSMLMK